MQKFSNTKLQKQLPHGLTKANYRVCGSLMTSLQYLLELSYIEYKLPSMTQFHILNSSVPTINNTLSVTVTCIVAMKFDRIISDLLKNVMSGLKLSTNEFCYIWGRYVLITEQDKFTIQYTYHVIKVVHTDLSQWLHQDHPCFMPLCCFYVATLDQSRWND